MKADLRRLVDAADPDQLTRALAMLGPPPAAIIDSPDAAAAQLRPLLADHVIIAGLGSTSFRTLGLISGGRMSTAFSA